MKRGGGGSPQKYERLAVEDEYDDTLDGVGAHALDGWNQAINPNQSQSIPIDPN